VTKAVIDASVAIKWVVQEIGSPEALILRSRHQLAAPDLLAAECANILWKKVQRGQMTPQEAEAGGALLQRSGLELLPMRRLLTPALHLSISLAHPAYDCIYLAAAMDQGCPFITADESLVRKLHQGGARKSNPVVMTLEVAVRDL
jgi:predicted nucleic acid-binding protein